MVTQTALRASEALVRWARSTDAEWAIRQGLLLNPYDERLYRALLSAIAAQGNRARLPSTMAELRTLAGDAYGSPAWRCADLSEVPSQILHPSTTELYLDLLQGVPAAGGRPARL
jgi:hypothetical protein